MGHYGSLWVTMDHFFWIFSGLSLVHTLIIFCTISQVNDFHETIINIPYTIPGDPFWQSLQSPTNPCNSYILRNRITQYSLHKPFILDMIGLLLLEVSIPLLMGFKNPQIWFCRFFYQASEHAMDFESYGITPKSPKSQLGFELTIAIHSIS